MISYKAGKERGTWYELKCIIETINSKESKEQDASFERSLLPARWKEFNSLPEYHQNIGRERIPALIL